MKPSKDEMRFTLNEVAKSQDPFLSLMSEENVHKALTFHRSFPQYSVTPLAQLNKMAHCLPSDSGKLCGTAFTVSATAGRNS